MTSRHAQRGAAILAAMVLVTMVASIAATAMAWQSRSVDVQIAERARTQALWLLRGAMDWSRLLLRQDAQTSSSVDHLAEPWAIPLQETKLTAFIQADNGVHQVDDASADVSEAFLAGSIEDLQAKINLAKIATGSGSNDLSTAADRLFQILRLPQSELALLSKITQQTQAPVSDQERWIAPRRLEDLVWFGLSSQTLDALRPYAHWDANAAGKVNLNTASAIVLQAADADLKPDQAQALVNARIRKHFQSIKDAQSVLGESAELSDDIFTVKSSFFVAQGWVRMDGIALSLKGQLERKGTSVTATDVSFQGVPIGQ